MNHHSFVFALSLAAGAALAVAACSATGNHIFGNNGGSGAGGGGAGSGLFGSGAGSGSGFGGGLHVGEGGPGVCSGLQCSAQTDNCAGSSKSPTTISGTVYDPAGSLPLYNVYVYIPNSTPDPIVSGSPACTQCEAPASGNPVIGTLTDASGHFTLSQGATDMWGVPSGDNIPLVLQVGKWRRQVVIPHVDACGANALPDPSTPSAKLRLPAKSSEGDMPLIAFTSGCDPAECFLRHVGIDDSEFVPPGGPGHVHFYTGQDADSFTNGDASNVAGGNNSADTYTWWLKSDNLLKYDIIFNACECNPNDRNMYGTDAYGAMDDYLNGGGRLFATHYYYNWFAPPTGPSDENGVVNWEIPEGFNDEPYNTFYIDSSFPKGKAYADWLQAQNVTSTYGEIDLQDTRWDMTTTTAASTRWIFNANSTSDAKYATMYMSFNSPVAQPAAMQCGRAVFSDVHLSGTSDDSVFPNECENADPDGSHAINEKALEFLFFDLSSCVQDNSSPPIPPPPPT
jgi:hypothetical protein